MFFSNEDKIIIQNDYEEKSCSAYKIWKNHPSRKWDYSSVKCLFQNFGETFSMGRKHGSERPSTVSVEDNMDLIDELVCSQKEQPHTHLALRKITEQTRISRSSTLRMVKKETLNSSKPWKHYKWVKGLKTEEKPALSPLDKDLKETSVKKVTYFGKQDVQNSDGICCNFMVCCNQTFFVNNSGVKVNKEKTSVDIVAKSCFLL